MVIQITPRNASFNLGRAIQIAFIPAKACVFGDKRGCVFAYRAPSGAAIYFVSVHSGVGGEGQTLRHALEGTGINQAGLSWITILKKADNFRKAYRGFDVDKVAKFTEKDRARLLADAGIIRNRLKVNAAIENAKRIRELRKEFGSFKGWLDAHHPLTKDEWTKLFKKTFVFTGGEIVNEFLMSAGYLPGAHDEDCPVYKKVASLRPAWMRK